MTDLKVATRQRLDGLLTLLTAKQGLIKVIKHMTLQFQPSDPAALRHIAIKECLPAPLQMIMLLTMCSDAKKLSFENVSVSQRLGSWNDKKKPNQMAAWAATKITLQPVQNMIESISMDTKGYAHHGVGLVESYL